MSLLEVLLLLLGVPGLIGGAEMLVRSASRLAAAVGMPPLLIALTVVAFGTNAAELAIAIRAVLADRPELSLGDVIGSNIANLLVALGLAAIIIPLVVRNKVIRVDLPIMALESVLAMLLMLDGTLSRTDGVLLGVGLLVYLSFRIRHGWKVGQAAPAGEADQAEHAAAKHPRHRPVLQMVLLLVSFGLLTISSRWVLDGAVAIAEALGISDVVIGLTVVAIGTSLPEIVTAAVAAWRGQRDIAVGSIVGSNIFNILGILSILGLLSPGGVVISPIALHLSLPLLIASAIACLPIFVTGHTIARWEGGLFLGVYLAYTAYLILSATGGLPPPRIHITLFILVLPFCAAALLPLARSIGHRDRSAD
jgi:cation:H+ antiporter